MKASSLSGNFEPQKISTKQILEIIDEYFEKRAISNWYKYSGEICGFETVIADRLLAKNNYSCRGSRLITLRKFVDMEGKNQQATST